MVTELKKITGSASSNTPSSTRDVMYRIQFDMAIRECLQSFECIVKKTEQGFVITQNNKGLDDTVKRPSKITSSFTLNIPKKLVDPWNDLGSYKVALDYDSHCVYLIKI